MNLKLMEDDLCIIDRNLIYLNRIKRDLEYNIQLHRSGSTISVIKEYKRSMEELGVADGEILKYEHFRDNLKKEMKIKLDQYEKRLDEFESIYIEEVAEERVLPFKGRNGR